MRTGKKAGKQRKSAKNAPGERLPLWVFRETVCAAARPDRKRGRLVLKVRFYPCADDALLKFAVVAARQNGRWVFCRHRRRTTWECPGGHREPGESIEQAARRELWEETGAQDYRLEPVCVYSVVQEDGTKSFGMLYRAEILRCGPLPPLEIAEVRLLDKLPARQAWTYPEIQPLLLERAAAEKKQAAAPCG